MHVNPRRAEVSEDQFYLSCLSNNDKITQYKQKQKNIYNCTTKNIYSISAQEFIIN